MSESTVFHLAHCLWLFGLFVDDGETLPLTREDQIQGGRPSASTGQAEWREKGPEQQQEATDRPLDRLILVLTARWKHNSFQAGDTCRERELENNVQLRGVEARKWTA